jgi:hypothetical protein
MTNGQFFSMQTAGRGNTVESSPFSANVLVPESAAISQGSKGGAQSIGITDITIIELKDRLGDFGNSIGITEITIFEKKERLIGFVMSLIVLVVVAVFLMKASKGK